MPYTPGPLADELKNEFPEVKNSVTILIKNGFRPIKYKEKIFIDDRVCWADPSIFEIFSFPFVEGNHFTSLSNWNSVVLTENMSKKYFGSEDPVGKILNIDRNDFIVTGVIENVPQNSHLQFDCIISFEYWRRIPFLMKWERSSYNTYVLLQNEKSFPSLNSKISPILHKHLPETKDTLYLQPLKKIHLNSSHLLRDHVKKGEKKYVTLFIALALVILIIACINYMNLSTARSVDRAREVGMRKVIGAYRRDIIKQFFGESLVLTVISLFLALLIVWLFLPAFNTISGKRLFIDFTGSSNILVGLIGITLLTGLISGTYPAIFLSSFQPVPVLKGSFRKSSNRSSFRKILVIIQFSLSISLIICTSVIHKQLGFIRDKDLGYNRENLVIMGAMEGFYKNFEGFKQELLQHPNVLSVGRGIQPIWDVIGTTIPDWEGKNPNQEIVMQRYMVGYDYFKTYEMEIIQGRTFSKEFSTDTSNYILNEAAVKAIGLESPIGKRFSLNNNWGQIIGVVKDFHHSSLHKQIQPVVFKIMDAAGFAVKVKSIDEETIDYLKAVWKRAVPSGYPFENDFLAPKIDNFYRTEKRVAALFNYFTILAIFISCLGLLGLISYMAESRTKEIGIRKVLGAPVIGIILILSKEFIFLVMTANLIAWPVAFFIMKGWLQNFSYKTNLNIGLFIFSAFLALIISLLTIWYQALKAARLNPVKSLKYE